MTLEANGAEMTLSTAVGDIDESNISATYLTRAGFDVDLWKMPPESIQQTGKVIHLDVTNFVLMLQAAPKRPDRTPLTACITPGEKGPAYNRRIRRGKSVGEEDLEGLVRVGFNRLG